MPWQETGEQELTWVRPGDAIQAVTKAWGERIQDEKPALRTSDPRPEYRLPARIAISTEIARTPLIDCVEVLDDNK